MERTITAVILKGFPHNPPSLVLDLLSEFPEQTVMDGVADGSLGLDQQMLSDSALFIFSLAKESIQFFLFCCRQMLFSC